MDAPESESLGPGGRSGRWVLFAGVYAVYFAFGVVALSIPPLVGEVRADLGLSRVAMGLALGAWQLVYLGSAPPAGRLVDRLGVRRAIAIGGLVVIASGLLRAAAGNLPALWAAIALFGVGGPLISAGAPRAVALWFDDRRERRVAVGVYSTAPALGGVVTLVLSNSVLMPLTGSWRWTVVIETGSMVLALVGWLVVTGRIRAPMSSSEATEAGAVGAWRVLGRDPRIRLILALGLGVFFVAHGLGGWMPALLRTHSGFSSMAAANWVAVGSGVGVAVSLWLPGKADGRRLPFILAGVMLVVSVALLAILVAPTALDPLPVAAAGVRAVMVPLVLVALMESKVVGPHNMGVAYGLWFAVAELGGVSGPLVMGWVADTDLGFGGALVLMSVACVLVALVATRLRGPASPEVGSVPTAADVPAEERP
ncbi:MAG: MFS transporter [Acidimicrobiales bacterium]|nr:MFS transporter [Acidimicrobiales bacterium]